MKTFMFPGQGSQMKGMGENLFTAFPDIVEKANEILNYSIVDLCLRDPESKLNNTQFTQPALFVVNALSYFKELESEPKPEYLVGHSLGEFNALLAAECFDFETGLRLVKKRGEIMSEIKGGAMAAILNASPEKIRDILDKNNLSSIDLANFNAPNQTVISGLRDDITNAQQYFQQDQMLYIPLNTSGAFHSRYMKSAQDEFTQFLSGFSFSDLKIPVVSNFTAQPYKNDEIAQNISNQLASTVKWVDSIHYLMEKEDMKFKEIGVGDVLTKLVHKISSSKKTKESSTTIKIESIEKSAATPANSPNNDNLVVAKPGIEVITNFKEKRYKVDEQVELWNKKYPVGTRVRSTFPEYGELETRTKAVILFGHRAAIYLNGYEGYFDLNDITPVY